MIFGLLGSEEVDTKAQKQKVHSVGQVRSRSQSSDYRWYNGPTWRQRQRPEECGHKPRVSGATQGCKRQKSTFPESLGKRGGLADTLLSGILASITMKE